jgi:predicted transcriptional regulator
VCRDPGIHFSAVRVAIATDSRTLQLHLRMLERYEYIREHNFQNNRVYYEISVPQELDQFYYFLHKDKAVDIFRAILSEPGISIARLTDVLKDSIPRSSLHRKVKTLVDLGLLEHDSEDEAIESLSLPENCVEPFHLFRG